jgi:iron(III) transport system substrate-binding protein
MHGPMLTRRQTMLATLGAGSTMAFAPRPAAAQVAAFTPPPALVEAARKEGQLTFYTASFTEAEQEVITAFNKRFPFIRVSMIRASGGQLITRVRSEAAAGKLVADIVDHSDRGLMKSIEELFADYAPPNAADYLPSAMISGKFWPRITPVWCIAYNTELQTDIPNTWMDLTKTSYAPGTIGQVIGPSGGTTWTRLMFERQVLGDEYWRKQAATKPTLYPSGAPASDALVRGEIQIAPLIRNAIYPKVVDGAPIKLVFPSEGIPIVPYASGIPKTAAHPNAAKLYLDWGLSPEGQTFTIQKQGNLTSLKEVPVPLEGFDPKVNNVWLPDNAQFATLRDGWIEEWNKIYGYRQ